MRTVLSRKLIGQKPNADDPLHLRFIIRVRQMVGRSRLLYVGDCKMAALGPHGLTSSLMGITT
jgi:hypothetical protein